MIYFPGATKMFQFEPFPALQLLVLADLFTAGFQTSWRVAPFRDRRIRGSWHLPDEYRRRVRLSSVTITKASINGIMSRFCLSQFAWD